MELFTLGRGQLHRAGRGRGVARVHRLGGQHPRAARRPRVLTNPPWTSTFVPSRFDAGTKTLLGTTGEPRPGRRARRAARARRDRGARSRAKLYAELVGTRPVATKTVKRLGEGFRDSGYEVMPLVEAIVRRPGVPRRRRGGGEGALADREARRPDPGGPAGDRSRWVVVGPRGEQPGRRERAADARLRAVRAAQRRRVPRRAARCSGPHQMVHTFDLLSVYPTAPAVPDDGRRRCSTGSRSST